MISCRFVHLLLVEDADELSSWSIRSEETQDEMPSSLCYVLLMLIVGAIVTVRLLTITHCVVLHLSLATLNLTLLSAVSC